MAAIGTLTRLTAAGPVTWFADLVAAEWIKFRATRSTYYCLLALTVVGMGVGVLITQAISGRWANETAADHVSFDPLNSSFRGFDLGQLIIGSLGVLMISSEYSTGLIRTTLCSVPQRRSLLAAKAVVIGAVALVVGEVAAFATFFITQAILHSTGASLSISSPGALRGTSALGLYIAVVALLGLALGVLLRHTAGAISALFGLVFIAPGVVSALPSPWNVRIGEWLPENLAGQLISLHGDSAYLSRPVSLAALLGYVVVFLAAAGRRLGHSDA